MDGVKLLILFVVVRRLMMIYVQIVVRSAELTMSNVKNAKVKEK
jgi:hypothetical protein